MLLFYIYSIQCFKYNMFKYKLFVLMHICKSEDYYSGTYTVSDIQTWFTRNKKWKKLSIVWLSIPRVAERKKNLIVKAIKLHYIYTSTNMHVKNVCRQFVAYRNHSIYRVYARRFSLIVAKLDQSRTALNIYIGLSYISIHKCMYYIVKCMYI